MALVCLFAAACTGLAGQPDQGSSEGIQEPSLLAGERLLAQPPAGWRQIGGTTLPTLRRAEFIPDGESESDWTRRITFEAMVENPLPDPITFVDALAADRQRECEGFERHPTFSGEENGYPTSVNLLVCGRDRKSDLSEVMLVKTIRGNDAFYIITRGRRGPPVPKGETPDVAAEDVGAWALYLRAARLCDTRLPDHPCPQAGTDIPDDSE